MKIIQGKPEDLVEVMYLIRVCVKDMNSKGLKYWNTFYPGGEIIKEDLERKTIFLAKEKGVCKGMITLDEEAPEDYMEVKWESESSKPLYVHRMAVHPSWQGTGIDKLLLEFAEKYATDNKHTSLRLDIFGSDSLTTQFYKAHQFIQSGEFHSNYQKTPFICYEKKF